MELAPESTYQARLAQQFLTIGAGPFGNPGVGRVTGGWVKGERMNGSLVGSAADWALIGPDGWIRLDVRGQVQPDDWALIYVIHTGLLEATPSVQEVLTGTRTQTELDDHYFRTTSRLDTGDERHGWVNQTSSVASGHFVEGGVEYEVFRVT